MKRLFASLYAAAALAAVAAIPCLAADSPWNGTWKLDPSKSTLTGDTFTISSAGERMHYSNGSTIAYDFACDGRDYNVLPDRTVNCSRNADKSYDSLAKIKGVETARTHRTLSSDGKTMTVTIHGKHPDGAAYTENEVYTRVSGTSGMLGTWKNVKLETSAPDVLIIKAMPPDELHWVAPAFKETADGKTDGKPIPLLGPTVPAGLTLSIKKVTPTKDSYEIRLNDKLMATGEQVLSADGKMLTDTSWLPGKLTEKEIDVYVKQ